PPLTYWTQVASFTVFGETDFAARLPSAIAAALTAVVVLAWGSRISGMNAGLWAATIFTLCLQTFVHAKAAVADMWLVLFMTIASWAGLEWLRLLSRKHDQRLTNGAEVMNAWWWILFFSLALAFLAKGPIGFIPLIPVIWMCARQSQRRLYWGLAAGIVLTLAIVFAWAVPAMVRTQGEFLRIGIGRHVIGRSLGAMEGH